MLSAPKEAETAKTERPKASVYLKGSPLFKKRGQAYRLPLSREYFIGQRKGSLATTAFPNGQPNGPVQEFVSTHHLNHSSVSSNHLVALPTLLSETQDVNIAIGTGLTICNVFTDGYTASQGSGGD